MTALPEPIAYDETQALQRLANGDENALAAIYHRYWKPLYIQAYNILKDRMVCEDIIQEIFLQLWRKRETLNITQTLQGYLSAATRYQVFHYIRKMPKREFLFENLEERITAGAGLLVEEKDLHEQINEIVSRLPEKCRVIYKLSREEYLPHKEIAARLHISIKTVENQLTIALRRLRVSLKDAVMVVWVVLMQG
jgi:RNA polymerase sigma-70 factor (ECF subfamily)